MTTLHGLETTSELFTGFILITGVVTAQMCQMCQNAHKMHHSEAKKNPKVFWGGGSAPSQTFLPLAQRQFG